MKKKNPYNPIRWIARITGTLMVVFTLFMFVGEMLESHKRHNGSAMASFSPIILMMFLIWGIALTGLIVALWNEKLGGIISLVSFILVYILNLFNKEAAMGANAIFIFIIFCVPSILYLIYWKLNKDEQKLADAGKPAGST
jgi:hypothetical protein